MIVTKEDEVYALGSNTAGCLGTGDTHSSLHPRRADALCNKGIKTFAYGSGPHVLALTCRGEVLKPNFYIKCFDLEFSEISALSTLH